MIINEQSLSALQQAITLRFNAGLARATTPWQLIAMEIPSVTAENVYPYLERLGKIRKWLGDREIQNLSKGEFKIVNEDYEETHGVPRNAILDDTYGLYGPMFEQTGQNVANFPSDQLYPMLKAGFSTLGPDGQYFFDTDHPVGSASVSNFMGGSGEPWFLVDSSQVFKPMIYQPRQKFDLQTFFDPRDPKMFWEKQFVFGVDGRAGFGFGPFWQLCFASKQTLDATNFAAALTAMASQKDREGNPLGVGATDLVVGPALFEAANRLLNKELTTGGETNEFYKRVRLQLAPKLL